jgi:2'-5' RNA ligase
MERATVIVALPPVDDRINKISSEGVAHLTLLYLGDVELSEDAVLYVQHACEELSPFGLSVDYRGTLGEDEADVLFFEKNAWDIKRVSEFRHYLLLNDEIKRAYDNAEQHEEWTPHLTLGYPEAPAREMDDDERRVHYVDFNRVAVWFGDFEGPEFRLKYDDYGMDVAMSDISTVDRGKQATNELFHFGVKGMKWGVRRRMNPGSGEGNSGGHDPSLSTRQRKKDDKWRYKVNLDAPGHAKAAKYANKADFDAINKKPEYKDLDFMKPSPTLTKYNNEIHGVWAKAMTDYVAKKHGATNPSKTKKMEWSWSPKYQSYSSKMVPATVKHADDDEFEPVTEILNDEDGYIVGFVIHAPTEATHGDIFATPQEALAHYGVKGMRWGVTTKDRATQRTPTPVTTTQKKPGKYTKAKGGKNIPAHEDAIRALELRQKAKSSTTDALSNSDLREAIARMNLENQYHSASFSSDRRSKGARFAAGLFGAKRYGKKRQFTDPSEESGEYLRSEASKAAAAVRTARKAAAAAS